MGDIPDIFERPVSHLVTEWTLSSACFLQLLPDETWSECFLWLNTADIYSVSQTCQRLRRVALASSRLWATATAACDAKFHATTVRSREAPLYLQLGRDFVPSESALRLCATRIREVSLILRWDRTADWSALLHVPMPMLDTFRVRPGVFETYTTPIIPLHWGRDYVPKLRFLRTPSIRLATPSPSSPSDDYGSFSQLETLDVCLACDEDLATLLRQSPNLRILRVQFQKLIPIVSAVNIPRSLQEVSLLCPGADDHPSVSFLPVAHWPLPNLHSLNISGSSILSLQLYLPRNFVEESLPLSLDARWPWNWDMKYGHSTVALAWDATTEQHTVSLKCAATPDTYGPDLYELAQPDFAARFTSLNIDPRIFVQLVREGASFPEVTSLTIFVQYECIREGNPKHRIRRDFIFRRLLAESTGDPAGTVALSMLRLPRLSEMEVNFTGSFPEHLSLESSNLGHGLIEEAIPAVLNTRVELTNGLEHLSINLPALLCESPADLCSIYYALQRNVVHHVDVDVYDSDVIQISGGEWTDPCDAIREELEFIPALRN